MFAAALMGHRLPIRIYTSANGVPRNSARCMTPDANGMMWLCTSEGLVRFDGYQFRVFGPENGLPSRSIFDLVLSRKGGYWLVTDAGVCRIPAGSRIGDRCIPLAAEGVTGDFQPESLVESPDGTTWIATMRSLYQVSDDGRRLVSTPFRIGEGAGYIETLAMTRDGTLIVATDLALYAWKPGEAQRDITSRLAPFPGVTQIFARDGDVWLVTPRGLYRMRGAGSALELFDFPHGKAFRRVVEKRDGSLWAAGPGLARLEMRAGKLIEVESYSTAEGLPAAFVLLLAEDRQGDLWGATDGAGIFRIADSGFTAYSEADGLGSARIGAVFESLRGEICVIHSANGSGDQATFAAKNGPRFEPVRYGRRDGPPAVGWGWNQIGLQAHDGEWWLASGAGLLRFPRAARAGDLSNADPIAVYDASSSLGENQIFRVFEDSHGDVWISGLNPTALVRWDRKTGRFHRVTAREGWPEDRVMLAIREAPSGTLWIGTYGEIFRRRKQRFELVPAVPSAQVAYLRDLFIDSRQRVWIATSRYGLFRCDDPEADRPVFRNYTTRDGLSSDSVRSITEDDAGLIYVGTVRGIDRIDPGAPAGSHRIRHFTPAEGVPDSEQNVAFRARDGRLWFGSLGGLAEFDPLKAQPAAPPQVYITRLRVRGEDLPLPWQGVRSFHADLAPEKNQFEIQYAGVDLASVASLRYQYRLGGVDRDWSEPVDQVTVNYASLPAGSFRFEVRAVSADGQPGEPAELDVSVAAPVWRRGWSIALMGAALAALATALYQYRVRHLLALERLRTRLAGDLHDDIGASLTRISILAELGGRGDAREVLDRVAGIARGAVADMSDIVWAVNPQHDRFEALAHRMRRFAADTLGDTALEFDASSLPEDFSVPLEYRRPLYLVFKEAANNVARHSGATRAVIRVSLDRSGLQLMVEDNGCGFDADAPRDGEGIHSIRRRMRDIGGSARWERAPGGGTRFTAILPLDARKLPELRGIFRRRLR